MLKTCRAKSGRIIAPMTQARTASVGVVTPPPLQRWLNAVLMLFAELVHGVATTLGMWRRVGRRACDTQSDVFVLPQAKSDIHLKEKSGTASLRLAVDAQRRANERCDHQAAHHQPKSSSGLTRGSFFNAAATRVLADRKQDSRVKPENDAAHVARSLSLSFRAKAQRAADPEPRGYTHRRCDTQLLASGSRLRASGMTSLVCQRP